MLSKWWDGGEVEVEVLIVIYFVLYMGMLLNWRFDVTLKRVSCLSLWSEKIWMFQGYTDPVFCFK
jgi:hypothetical protein